MYTEFYKPMDIGEATDLLNHYKDKAIIVNGGTDIVIGDRKQSGS